MLYFSCKEKGMETKTVMLRGIVMMNFELEITPEQFAEVCKENDLSPDNVENFTFDNSKRVAYYHLNLPQTELFDENSVIYLSEISTSGLYESLTKLLDKDVRKKYCHEISKVYKEKTSQTKINAVFDRSVRDTLAQDS